MKTVERLGLLDPVSHLASKRTPFVQIFISPLDAVEEQPGDGMLLSPLELFLVELLWKTNFGLEYFKDVC
jgi:hypothetical protein